MLHKTPRRAAPILAVIAVSCAMLAGLTYVLQRHGQQVESYPAYSSFRTLPEGTSVLYEALSRHTAMKAVRNTQSLGAVHHENAAILILGIQPASLTGWFNEAEELADRGNRVIFGLLPHHYRFIQPSDITSEALRRRWGIRVAFVRENDMRDEEEDSLTTGWPMYFAQSTGWEITRQESGRAVMIERAQGKGSIVLLANPYLLSNAAMVEDRQTTFLANLIGPVHQAIFDETHFGIEETGSIAALARRYRLQGLVLALVLTASLFIWKNAAGFPPPWSRLRPAQPVMGEDSSAAFLNLLRRNIKPDDILATCVEAWRKMYERKSGGNVQAAIDAAERGRKTPARTYAQIQQILTAPRPFLTELRPLQQAVTEEVVKDGAKQNQS